jgi:hypothetical protein
VANKKRHQLDLTVFGMAVLQVMDFIKKHYHYPRRWQVQSGNQKPPDPYCGNWPYLLLYLLLYYY